MLPLRLEGSASLAEGEVDICAQRHAELKFCYSTAARGARRMRPVP